MQNDGLVPASAEVNGGQGVVVGSGVQNNYWLKPPLDLAALTPHAAVDRIRDTSHNDAVDVFAGTPQKDLTEVLRVLLRADESKAVAILADVNPRKAAELIGPHEEDFPWLACLPAAAKAIAEHGVILEWHRDLGAGRLERAVQSLFGTTGYFRRFEQGRIYWNGKNGETYAVCGLVAKFHLETSGTRGELGFPVAPAETGNGITQQRFEAGVVYSSAAGTFGVRAEVADLANGAFPVSSEKGVPFGTAGRVQRFTDSVGRDVAVYSTSDTGVYRVVGQTLAFYERLGGPGSNLGFPTSNSARIRGDGWCQEFEHGSIYHRKGHGLTAVPAETLRLTGSTMHPLGWPTSAEKSVDGRAEERIQFFEHGVVTVRDGKREIWLRQR